MEQVEQIVRPKIGRPPALVSEQSNIGVSEGIMTISTKRMVLFGGVATVCVCLLFAFLVSQGSEGVMSRKIISELEKSPNDKIHTKDTAKTLKIESASGKETLSGRVVVVSSADAAPITKEKEQLSNEDKKLLLEIISRH